MKSKPLASTPLAYWLDLEMSRWRDPETQRRGISQRQLGMYEGLSQAQLSEVLTEGHKPKADMLDSLAKVFQVHPLILYYVAYELHTIDVDALDRLTRFGRAIYPLPEQAILRFLDDLTPQAEAALVAASYQKQPCTEV